MINGGFDVPLPEVSEWLHLLWWMQDRSALGWCGIGANGPRPFTPGEIMDFLRFVGAEDLPLEERQTLRAMSSAYCAGLNLTSPCDWSPMERAERAAKD